MPDQASAMPISWQTPSGLTVKRLQPSIGAEISGVDLCRPVAANVADDIRQALVDHGVIFFRNQPINYEQHLALARLFGEPTRENLMPDKPEIMMLKSDAANTNPAGGHWHSDGTYLTTPPAISILHAIKAAPLGGDTLFSSAVAAYNGLPDDVKAKIAPLRARASMSHIRKVKGLPEKDGGYTSTNPALPESVDHPVVRMHPENGKPTLYVNEVHTFELIGLEAAESTELLRYLSDRFKRPEYQVRWNWSDHGIAVWDNRQVQHYAVQDEAGPRHVERIMVAGTPTIGLMD